MSTAQTRPTPQVVEELRNARTAWLEQHGVPISMEFVRFANAIGEADDTIVRMLEALEAGLPFLRGAVEDAEAEGFLKIAENCHAAVQLVEAAIWKAQEQK